MLSTVRAEKKKFEPHREKTGFLPRRIQRRRSVTAKLISAFVFATRIVYFLFFLYPKFQASSLLLRLYSPVCVRPGRKPRRPVFSRRGSFLIRENERRPHTKSLREFEPVREKTNRLGLTKTRLYSHRRWLDA